MSSASLAELVFVVDVSSLTKNGFIGTTTYEEGRVDLEFDDKGEGVYLNSEMAGRLKVRKGSLVSVVIEGDDNLVAEAKIGGVSKILRISDPKVYYAIGRDGGAVVRVRKG